MKLNDEMVWCTQCNQMVDVFSDALPCETDLDKGAIFNCPLMEDMDNFEELDLNDEW